MDFSTYPGICGHWRVVKWGLPFILLIWQDSKEALPGKGSCVTCLNFQRSRAGALSMFHVTVNVAVGNLKKGCRLLWFHFKCCRYFLGHVACWNLPWQSLFKTPKTCRWKILQAADFSKLFQDPECLSLWLVFNQPRSQRVSTVIHWQETLGIRLVFTHLRGMCSHDKWVMTKMLLPAVTARATMQLLLHANGAKWIINRSSFL